MKTPLAVCSIISSLVLVSCEAPLRQAPYPPRGWRPNGPAFELPTEIESNKLVEEIITSEVNAESPGFQEYGAPPYQKEEQLEELTIQQLPEDSPPEFFKGVGETHSRSRFIEQEIEAETESRESSTTESVLSTTTIMRESELFVNESTEEYTTENIEYISSSGEESILTTTEISQGKTTGYAEVEERIETEEKLSALNSDLGVTLQSEEELLTNSLIRQTFPEQSTNSTLTETRLQNNSTIEVTRQDTTLEAKLQFVDVTTEIYTQTTASTEDEESLGTTREIDITEQTTFAPIVVLDQEEPIKDVENNLVTFSQSGNSEGSLFQSSNGEFQAGNENTQSKSVKVETIEEKLVTLQRQLEQEKVRSSSSSEIVSTGKQATAGTLLQTENPAELRNLDYTAPVGFAEYGVPFEQYGPPQSGARRLEADLTTRYELDSSTIKIEPAEPSSSGDKTPSDSPRDGRKRRFSPKIRNVNAVFRFNGKGLEYVNVL